MLSKAIHVELLQARHRCDGYLPLGRAVVVSADADVGVRLVAAPTMWLPQDVRGTHNAYHAMYAALSAAAASADPIHTLVTSGLCTGCCMMPAEQAVTQMRDAHTDFLAGKPPRYTADQVDAEQPPLYQNTEFKAIDPAAVVHS